MLKRSGKSRIDPELTRQIKSAGTAPVEAVYVLRAAASGTLSPEDTDRLARTSLARAEHQAGVRALDTHVFRNLGSFVVRAVGPLLLALARQPEIGSATANRMLDASFETAQTQKHAGS